MTTYVIREAAQPVNVATRRLIRRSEEDVGFAPCPDAVCVDSEGRGRPKHLQDGDLRCILCGAQEAES
jgi:hypothetical protein